MMNLKFLKLTKISLKLTLLYTVMFSVVLISLNGLILTGIKYYLVAQATEQVEVANKLIVEEVKKNIITNSAINWEFLIKNLQLQENIGIVIFEQNGGIIYQSDLYPPKLIGDQEFLQTTKKKEVENREFIAKIDKLYTLNGVDLYIQTIKNLDNEYDFLQVLMLIMAIVDLIGIILSIIIGFIVSKRILKPLDKITNLAKNISINDLNQRIEVKGPDDELTRLTKTFNEMIERLQIAFEKQSRFVSDASHELRTPIAIIQGYINLIDRWGKEDKNVLQEGIEAIKNETVHMTELIEKLLFIARGESKTQRIIKEELMFNELVEEIIKESKMVTPNREFISKRNDIVKFYGDYKLLKQMLRALIDNSIKYTQENGLIKIDCIDEGKQVKIVVQDNGIGIPQSDLPYIFDRFFRVDKARARKTGGSGLGLAIVKNIVELHNGNITVESEVDKYTRVIITFKKESN